MSPTPSLKSSGLPRYNNLGQISWCYKIDNFKLGQIEKIARQFLKRSHSGDDPIVRFGDKAKEKIFV